MLLPLFLSLTQIRAEEAGGEDYSYFLNIFVIYEDNTGVDSALIEVYDKDHRYLGQYYSDDDMMRFNVVQDTAINYYGIYYVKVSKPGYRTVECKMEFKDDAVQYSLKIVMKPARTYW